MREFKFSPEVQSTAHLRQCGRCAHCGVSLVWQYDEATPVFPLVGGSSGVGVWKREADNCVILCTGCTVWVGVEDPNSSTSLTDPDEFVFSHGAKKNGAHKEWVIRMMGRN